MLPEGSNVITVGEVGLTCPYEKFIKEDIIKYFKQNKNLFEENSSDLTTPGKHFRDYLQGKLGLHPFELKIHRGDGKKEMNDFYLNFNNTKSPCEDDSICNITCVKYPREEQICDRKDKIGTQSQEEGGHTPLTDEEYRKDAVEYNYPISSNNFLLSQLINISPEGGTYILITCRKTGSEEGLEVARTISGAWPTARN